MRALLWWLAILLVAFLGWMFAQIVSAQEDDSLRLDLARVLVGEADGVQADWAAILWTLQHRQSRSQMSLAAVARYSAVLRLNTERARSMRALGTPDAVFDSPARERQWARALAFVDHWRAGAVKDPCPRSLHWGGFADTKPARRVVVNCGLTLNEFYYCLDRSC